MYFRNQVRNPDFLYYDQGWNDRVNNKPRRSALEGASRDYRDGWQDCDDALEEDRTLIE